MPVHIPLRSEEYEFQNLSHLVLKYVRLQEILDAKIANAFFSYSSLGLVRRLSTSKSSHWFFLQYTISWVLSVPFCKEFERTISIFLSFMNDNSEMNKKVLCSNNLLDNEDCNQNIILHMTLFRKKRLMLDILNALVKHFKIWNTKSHII